jgi:regulator of sigma E protease
MLITVLAFLITIGILIVVHEYGHYRVARWCGVKVLRFSVGFGRVIWSRRSADGVEFSLSLLPLGGYVRMLDSREAKVLDSERPLAFDYQSLPKRAAIVSAGPLANLLLAVVLYALASWWGTMEPKAIVAEPPAGSVAAQAGISAGQEIHAFSIDGMEWQEVRSMTDVRWAVSEAALDGRTLSLDVSDARGGGRRVFSLPLARYAHADLDARLYETLGLGGVYSEPVLGDIQVGGPASLAGLRTGDRVLVVDGQAVPDAQTLRTWIRARDNEAASPMRWLIERANQRLEVYVKPRLMRDENGVAFGRIDAFVGQMPAMILVRDGFIDGWQDGLNRTWDTAWTSLRMLGRMIIGQASLKQLSGPLSIADYAGQSMSLGLAYYLGFLAMVSVSLGVLNLLPLPILDGGHLLYYLYEGVTGHPVPDAWLIWLQRGGAIVLLLMMSIALSNDVARLLGL